MGFENVGIEVEDDPHIRGLDSKRKVAIQKINSSRTLEEIKQIEFKTEYKFELVGEGEVALNIRSEDDWSPLEL